MKRYSAMDGNDHHVGNDHHDQYRLLRYVPMVSIKEVACYLSLLEGSRIQDKLECEYYSSLCSDKYSLPYS